MTPISNVLNKFKWPVNKHVSITTFRKLVDDCIPVPNFITFRKLVDDCIPVPNFITSGRKKIYCGKVPVRQLPDSSPYTQLISILTK